MSEIGKFQEYGDDLGPIEEDDETTPHNEEQTEAFTEPPQEPIQETDPQPDNAADTLEAEPTPEAEPQPDLNEPQETPTEAGNVSHTASNHPKNLSTFNFQI